MKSEVLYLNRSVEEAIFNGMLAVEAGRFNKVITLLEYAKQSKINYDIVMVNYALLISYMNVGEIKKAQQVLKDLELEKIDNQQIANVIESIKDDLKVKKSNKITEKSNDEYINKALNFIDINFANQCLTTYPDDGIWKYYLDSRKGDKEALKIYLELYDEALSTKNFLNVVIKNFESFDEHITPLVLYNYMLDISTDHIFWYTMNQGDWSDIFNNKNLPLFAKKFFLERRGYTKEYGFKTFEHENYEISGKNYLVQDLFPVLETAVEFAQSLGIVFDEANAYYSDEIFETMTSVFKIILIECYPDFEYRDKNKLEAIGGYIVSDLLLGRSLDIYLEEYTKYKFQDVKEEILKFETLITFLLS